MSTTVLKTLAGAAVGVTMATVITLIATSAAGDVRRCKDVARSTLTAGERTSLATLATGRWPAALSTIDGFTFKRIPAGGVRGVIVGCYAGTDLQIAARLAGGAPVTNGIICDRVEWVLSAGERTTLGSVVSRYHPTLADVEEFHGVRVGSEFEAWAVVGETLTDAQALAAAKAGTVRPGCN